MERDPAARTQLEVLLCYPGLWAVWIHRVSHGLWRRKLRLPARILSQVARFFTGVNIHPGALLGARLFIDHATGVVIGETAIVGSDVTMYQGVTLGGTGKQHGKRHPTICDGVFIGNNANILGNGSLLLAGQLDLVARQMRGQLLVPRRLGLLQLPPHQIFLDDLLGFDHRVGDAVLHRRVVAEIEVHLIRVFVEPLATMAAPETSSWALGLATETVSVTVQVKVAEPDEPESSVAVMVTDEVPPEAGVPVMVPDDGVDGQAGREPGGRPGERRGRTRSRRPRRPAAAMAVPETSDWSPGEVTVTVLVIDHVKVADAGVAASRRWPSG